MKTIITFIFLISATLAFAQNYGVPTKYMNDPAVDLVRNGQLLFPDEVHDLYAKSKGKFDISSLNPVETSDLWKNQFPKGQHNEIAKINAQDTVHYHSPVLSPSGIFRFNILNKNSDNKIYTVMLSKTVHTALLLKSLLRKIGYQVPDIKYLPQIEIKFKSTSEKVSFIAYLEEVAMAGSVKNWLVSEDEDSLILQDLVVMNSQHDIYNLAFGVTSDMVQGRRLLSAVAIPHTIVNLTESINMLRWNAGNVSNKTVQLHLDNADEYQTTWDDARWISRRIEKLTREDWEEVVEASNLPLAIQQVLVEKIISRRNSILKIFKIDHKNLKVDSKISNGIEVVDGKIVQEKWPGYASRFAHGDPESPLSDSDMKSWVKSRAISMGMEIALAQINQLPYLGTDIKKINTEFQDSIVKAAKESVLSGKPSEIPVKAWVFPTFRGNLIFSRNLVTGTYLGTDNLVQLVDTVGVSVSAGAYMGTMGIGGQLFPISASASGQASFIRTYAHLRPVINIQRTLKYPFKNILVPLVKNDYGKLLHDAIVVGKDDSIPDYKKSEALEKAIKPLKDAMNIGESILVTDTLQTGVAGKAGARIYGNLFSASLGLSSSHIVLSRFHVHRKSEDDFHIYKDLGHMGTAGVSFALDSLVPLVKVTFKKSTGNAKVKHYSLNIDPKNPQIVKNLSALRKAIVNSSVKNLEAEGTKPFIVQHKFKQALPSLNLIFWQFNKQNSSTRIKVTNPAGESRNFNRHYFGSTQGKNYQAYVNSVVNHWVGMLFNTDSGLSEATGTNPGYSFKGSAKTKFLTYDQELNDDGTVKEPFINLTHAWNGWSVKRDKAEKILEEIRDHYKFPFYNGPVLNDTSKIFLYNIAVNILFYKDGINHLISLDENQIKRIFYEHQTRSSVTVTPGIDDEDVEENYNDEKYSNTPAPKFIRLMKRYNKYQAKGKTDLANKNLLKAISHMEKSIYLPGIVKMVGGEDNLYVTSSISGFRESDEDGERAIIGDSLGQFGSSRIYGPLVEIQRATNMMEGEFFINWFMQRLM